MDDKRYRHIDSTLMTKTQRWESKCSIQYGFKIDDALNLVLVHAGAILRKVLFTSFQHIKRSCSPQSETKNSLSANESLFIEQPHTSYKTSDTTYTNLMSAQCILLLAFLDYFHISCYAIYDGRKMENRMYKTDMKKRTNAKVNARAHKQWSTQNSTKNPRCKRQ